MISNPNNTYTYFCGASSITTQDLGTKITLIISNSKISTVENTAFVKHVTLSNLFEIK